LWSDWTIRPCTLELAYLAADGPNPGTPLCNRLRDGMLLLGWLQVGLVRVWSWAFVRRMGDGEAGGTQLACVVSFGEVTATV
jgi:hypothetical protein